MAQPKKRDNHDRAPQIPDTVGMGVKKAGPSIKQLQEEYGGAGNFYIPIEEHYQLEDESWKFDRWPEFYLGKNVMDFYDPDIEEKLKALEEEEEKLLKMEEEENELMDDESDEEAVTEEELRKALREVRGKKAIFKMEHKIKKNLRARSKNKKLEDFEEHLEKKGISANIESIKDRIKKRKTIGQLEDNQDKLVKKAFESSEDEEMEEVERAGRKRKRSMSDDEEDEEDEKKSKSKKSKGVRSMTPAQLKIHAQSKIRSMSKGRREGSVPQPHPTRVVPEE